MQLVTIVALAYGGLLEGAVLTETVFAWPGFGQYLTTALLNGDMNAVMACVLLVGVIFIGLNLLSDLLYQSSTRGRDDDHARGRHPPWLRSPTVAGLALQAAAAAAPIVAGALRAQPAGAGRPGRDRRC